MSILTKLFDENVIQVSIIGDLVEISEGCDSYYNVKLTKEELIQLINELQEIANKL